MTIHQCPKCELRFGWKTELDDHCWHDHPEFRHEYPATIPPSPAPEPHIHPVEPAPTRRLGADELVRWLVPRRGRNPSHGQHPASEPRTESDDA
jgi:hypothetical protein